MPSSTFERDVLKIAVAQICHSLGWNSLQKSSLAVLTDILERYMKKLSKATAWFCQNSCRTDVNLNDLGIAFDQLGIQLCELEDYVHQVEPISFPKSVPQFQCDGNTAIQFPTEEEIATREEWYDDYMPSLGRKVQKDEDEVIKNEENLPELENGHLELVNEQSVEKNGEIFSPPATLLKKRPAESPVMSPIESKKPLLDDTLFLPNLVRPELARLPSFDSPVALKKPALPSPTRQISPVYKEESPLKSLEKRSPVSLQENSLSKDSLKLEDLSPKTVKRPNVLSPPNLPEDRSKKSKKTKNKDSSRKSEILQTLDDRSRENYLNRNLLSSSSRDSLTSPRTSSTMKSPSSVKALKSLQDGSSPFLESPTNESRSEITSPLSDVKSKKVKKVKKAKGTLSSKSTSKKNKQNTINPFSNPTKLFTLPHILKSPPEQKAGMKTPQQPEAKMDQVISSYRSTSIEKASTSEVKTTTLPHAEDSAKEKQAKKSSSKKGNEKISGKKSKKSSVSSTKSNKEKSQSIPESPLKQLPLKENFKSPSGFTSPDIRSPKFSPVGSQTPTLGSPEYRTHVAKYGASEEAEKMSNKKLEKKRKKEKKAKKKPSFEEPKLVTDSQKVKKHETPSLKVTFKRAPSGAYHEQIKDVSPVMKEHGFSPAFSSPIETPTRPIESTPKVISPPPEKKSRSSKKGKSSLERADRKEKKVESAVRIEPLVINESFSESENDEPTFDWPKPEGKKSKSSKKDGSGKKGRPPKSVESGKKSSKKKLESPKKSETAKKPVKAKSKEIYEPDITPVPAPIIPTQEQSVPRGLFIQTITEPAQVWYCPACLRPDDGSPMIGCDSCDGWYHWTCVGITQAPSEDVEWYCETCVDRQRKRSKKRKKKD